MKKFMTVMLMITSLLIAGCSNDSDSQKNTSNAIDSQGLGMSCATCVVSSEKLEVEKIEIYHFHGNNQCVSCITVGNFAEETVNTYFSDELKSGKIVFEHINADLSENAALAKKYGVTGSSLWIGIYTKEGQFRAQENVNVWYKIRDKSDYMSYLKEVIDKRLAGDLS